MLLNHCLEIYSMCIGRWDFKLKIKIMKKLGVILSILSVIIVFSAIINGCKTSELITSKSGAQIWGETCIRCHNPTDPSTFSDLEWDVAAMHMQIRANLTPEETQKVVQFLQSAN